MTLDKTVPPAFPLGGGGASATPTGSPVFPGVRSPFHFASEPHPPHILLSPPLDDCCTLHTPLSWPAPRRPPHHPPCPPFLKVFRIHPKPEKRRKAESIAVRFSAATTAERLLPERLALRARPLLGRIDAVLFTADERGEAGRMSLIAFAIRIVSAAIAFISQVLLARWMGSFEYGIFVLVWVTMVIAGNVSCLGFHTSVIRFIPEYREKGMLAELRGILRRQPAVRARRLDADRRHRRARRLAAAPMIESYYVVPFILGMICLPMIALSRRAAGHVAGQLLGDVCAVADLSDAAGADPGASWRWRCSPATRPTPGRRSSSRSSPPTSPPSRSSSASPPASTARLPPGPRKVHFARMVRRVAADLPGRELLLPAHQRRRADGRRLHAARRRRRLFRHGEDAGAGAFRLFRGQGRRRPALCAVHPWRTGKARRLRPRDGVVDVLAVAGDGAASCWRSASRC